MKKYRKLLMMCLLMMCLVSCGRDEEPVSDEEPVVVEDPPEASEPVEDQEAASTAKTQSIRARKRRKH